MALDRPAFVSKDRKLLASRGKDNSSFSNVTMEPKKREMIADLAPAQKPMTREGSSTSRAPTK